MKGPQKHTPIQQIPAKGRSITSIGDKTTEAALKLFPAQSGSLFGDEEDGLDLDPLTSAFKQTGWSDDEAAHVIEAYADLVEEYKGEGREAVSIPTLAAWVLQHSNNSDLVNECINTLPPDEIEIIKVLSRAGSQKVVFQATWRLTQADIVLKKVIANTEATERIISRELRANPLNMVHPNIIETHILKNSKGVAFLVERKLPGVLYDSWDSQGIHEAANLLFDIAKAIKFLHDKGLVHGDIKPDNIGKDNDTYVLLDFGICREATAYSPEMTATGSLRTRAPELLLGEQLLDPSKVDIWALGATVYNVITKRFPLIGSNEVVPRTSNPNQRDDFEKFLKQRIETGWDQWVKLEPVPESMRSILGRMLERDPDKRISAKDVLDLANDELCAFIRSEGVRGEAAVRFSPVEELRQIDQYLNSIPGMATLLPANKRKFLSDRLTQIARAVGFGTEEKATIQDLEALLR